MASMWSNVNMPYGETARILGKNYLSTMAAGEISMQELKPLIEAN